MGRHRPDLDAAAGEMTAVAVRFARDLRAAHLHADLGGVIGFAAALTHLDLQTPDDVRAAGAAFFVDRPEERAAYDAAFDRFWLLPSGPVLPEAAQAGDAGEASASAPEPLRHPRTDGQTDPSTDGTEVDRSPAADEDEDQADDSRRSALTYSAAEALHAKAFEEMTPAELMDAAHLIDQLRPRIARRRTRRFRLHHRGRLLAPRAMMRRSLATGGDELDWLWRRRRTHPRRIVALCDISGSMEQHSRFALRFVHALTRIDVRTESFVFGTRLTRITSQLRHRDPDEALGAVAGSVSDWSGGTQLGSALHVFNRDWGRRVLRSSAIVIIVSDGWDRGDPDLVAREMALLRRRCRRLVWLNPLAATAGYQPRTAGMAAAYPFIDDFVGFRSVESLAHLGRLLEWEAAG